MDPAKGAAPVHVRYARRLAEVLDAHHVDPLVGFVLPGLGDALCGLLGLSLVGLAARQRVPRVTLARMLLNLALATGLGAIPLLGDAFDLWFRVNTRNARLLERASLPGRARLRDAAAVALALLLCLAALCLPLVLLVLVIRWARSFGRC